MAKKITQKKAPGKKPQVVVPEAGETQYIVINPAQIEKLEEAVNRLTAAVEEVRIDPTRISLAFPDDFWLRFWAGCFTANGCSYTDAPYAAVGLLQEMKKVIK